VIQRELEPTMAFCGHTDIRTVDPRRAAAAVSYTPDLTPGKRVAPGAESSRDAPDSAHNAFDPGRWYPTLTHPIQHFVKHLSKGRLRRATVSIGTTRPKEKRLVGSN